MLLLEWIVPLLIGAVALTLLAQHLGVPYPAFLALGGMALALMPRGPNLTLEPDLALALFVAPVILDTAYDASLRDLRANWLSISLLVVACVAVTAGAVALAARALLPDLPWSAAITLGAIVAPPDATAAAAILRQVHLPFRLSTILGGESLLNDASALFLYRLALGTFAMGGLHLGFLATSFALVLPISLAAGWLTAQLTMPIMGRMQEVAPAIILQFAFTLGLWMLADVLQLSAVLTLVAYAATISHRGARPLAARMRLPSFSVWETVVYLLNVLAFVLIGLQLRPILDGMGADRLAFSVSFALVILLVCILARLGWVMAYGLIRTRPLGRIGRLPQGVPSNAAFAKNGVVIGWCGMRGIVTLAAAFALPDGSGGTAAFPHRDLMLLTAFVAVLGTLLVQGLTLKPLLYWAALEDDDPVGHEIGRARTEINRAAMAALDAEEGPPPTGCAPNMPRSCVWPRTTPTASRRRAPHKTSCACARSRLRASACTRCAPAARSATTPSPASNPSSTTPSCTRVRRERSRATQVALRPRLTHVAANDGSGRGVTMTDLVGTAGAAAPAAAKGTVKATTTTGFSADVLNESTRQPVLVLFQSLRSEASRALLATLQRAVQAADGKVKLVTLDIDAHPQIPGRLGIRAVPAVYAFQRGQPVDGFMGPLPEAQIKGFIERLIGGPLDDGLDDILGEAEAALAVGDAEGAAEIFASVLQSDPEHLGAIAGLARALVEAGDLDAARGVLSQVPPPGAGDKAIVAAQAALDVAAQASEVGDLAELMAKLERDPDDHEARFDLAIGLNGKGKRAEAADALIDIMKRDKAWNEGAARKQLLQLFEAWGLMDPTTLAARRKLSTLLFS